MIEFILIFVVVLLILFLFVYIMQSESILILEKQKAIARIEKMLKIAEKKFMKGKIKREVFEELQNDLLAEKITLEFELNNINRAQNFDVTIKAETLVERSAHPSRHKKLTIRKLLEDTELLRSELGEIERRFLRHEIKESVFRKLIKDKESQLIRKESQIIELVDE